MGGEFIDMNIKLSNIFLLLSLLVFSACNSTAIRINALETEREALQKQIREEEHVLALGVVKYAYEGCIQALKPEQQCSEERTKFQTLMTKGIKEKSDRLTVVEQQIREIREQEYANQQQPR